MASEPRSLTDDLRGWSPQQRLRLFEVRPDLISPPPRSSAQLASRATTPASLKSALDQLNAFELSVLARVLDGEFKTPAAVTAEFGPLGSDAVQRLRERALIWGRESLRAVNALNPLKPLTDVHGCPEPPELATATVNPTQVARVGGGAAFDLVRHVEMLLDRWGTSPPGVLKAGGLGVRELKQVAGLLEVSEAHAATVIEVAGWAGLIGQANSARSGIAWAPTVDYDGWLDLDLPQRWHHLASTWLESPRLSWAVRTRDPAGRLVSALDGTLTRAWLPEAKYDVLSVFSQLPEGTNLAAGTGSASLGQVLKWLAPRRAGSRDQVIVGVVEEAARVGVIALGALTPAGRALLDGDAAADVLAPDLPALIEHVLIQADLTAVAPGPLTSVVGARLDLLADVESRGAATVYRFTESSLRRGLDAGWSAAEIHEFLGTVSTSPVPQALTYLVNDLARRFGSLRVGQARCYVLADDPGALDVLLAGRSSLGLRRIAATVAVSELDISTVLTRLREAGAAPAVEAKDGTLRVTRPEVVRARKTRDSRYHAITEARRIAAATAANDAIVAGDRAERDRPRSVSATTPADVLGVLREAIDRQTPVWIGYLDPQGRAHERVVKPDSVVAGTMVGVDASTGELLTYQVHRIRSAVITT